MAKAKTPGRRPMGAQATPGGQTVAVDAAPAKPRVSPVQFFQQAGSFLFGGVLVQSFRRPGIQLF